MRQFTSILTLLLAILGQRLGMSVEPVKDSKANRFGSAQNFDLINTATKVTVVRLTPPQDPKNPGRPDYSQVGEFKNYKKGEPIDLPKNTLTELRTILQDDSMDDPSSSKGCIPLFGVRFVFSGGKRELAVNLCYSCDIFWTTENDQIVGASDFDSVHTKLVSIAKKLFPEDKGIQMIKD